MNWWNNGGWDSMYPYVTEEQFAGRLNAQMGLLQQNKQLWRNIQQQQAQNALAGAGRPAPMPRPTSLEAYTSRIPGGRVAPLALGVPMASLGGLNPVEVARGDDVYYGLDSGASGVAASSSASLSTTPQKRHIPKRMTVTATVANTFVISDIRVGVEPVLATTSNMSMAVFIQDATAPSFRAVVCEIGMDFTVVVTNVSGAPARFTASVIGTYLPPAGC